MTKTIDKSKLATAKARLDELISEIGNGPAVSAILSTTAKSIEDVLAAKECQITLFGLDGGAAEAVIDALCDAAEDQVVPMVNAFAATWQCAYATKLVPELGNVIKL